MFGLTLVIEQQQTLLSLPIEGGSAGSIFPHVDSFLCKEENLAALNYVARRKSLRRYETVVDFLYCEVFPAMRRSCERWYDGKGPALADLIDEPRRADEEKRLLRVLRCARALYRARQYRSWSWLLANC